MTTRLRGSTWLLAATALLSFQLGRMALLDPDEARYAAASREMLLSGDLVAPSFNGEPRLNKPPLLYWLQSASFALFGTGEAAARAPSLAAALATLALVSWWAGRRLPGAAGRSVAALATTPLFFACARLAIPDMLLALGVTAALLCWHEAIRENERSRKRRLVAAAALACCLAALAKGPVGLALPACVIAAAAWLTRARGAVTARGAMLALGGVAVVAGPWAVALASRIGLDEALRILARETYGRTVGGLDHPRPFYYLLMTFWPAFLPWSLSAPYTVISAARASRRSDPVSALLVCWLLVTVAFFSLPADKNDAYLLPACPALALLAARELPPRLAWLMALLGMAIVVAAGTLAAEPLSQRRSLREAVLAAGLSPPQRRGDLALAAYKSSRPSLVYYSGSTARWLSRPAELRRWLDDLPAGRPAALVIPRERLERLPPDLRSRLAAFRRAGGQPGIEVLVTPEAGPPQPP